MWKPLHKRLSDRFRPMPLADSRTGIEAWFEGPIGQYLLSKERDKISTFPALSGYQLMELGVSPRVSLLDEFDNLHRFALACSEGGEAAAITNFEALPLPSDIIDCGVIHHALEFSPRPHIVLNEAARVIAPGGHLVLFVLNPLCLFGLSKWPGWMVSDGAGWQHHSLRLGRLVDWLRLLNFRSVHVKRGGFGRLVNDEASFAERWGYGLGLPAGLFYTIVARKHVARPINNRWKALNGNGLKVPNLSWQQPVRKTLQQPAVRKKREQFESS